MPRPRASAAGEAADQHRGRFSITHSRPSPSLPGEDRVTTDEQQPVLSAEGISPARPDEWCCSGPSMLLVPPGRCQRHQQVPAPPAGRRSSPLQPLAYDPWHALHTEVGSPARTSGAAQARPGRLFPPAGAGATSRCQLRQPDADRRRFSLSATGRSRALVTTIESPTTRGTPCTLKSVRPPGRMVLLSLAQTAYSPRPVPAPPAGASSASPAPIVAASASRRPDDPERSSRRSNRRRPVARPAH